MEHSAFGSSFELIIINNENKLISLIDSTKILVDTNMFIGDTVATCDVTFRKSGMTNTETPKESSLIVAYNDEN